MPTSVTPGNNPQRTQILKSGSLWTKWKRPALLCCQSCAVRAGASTLRDAISLLLAIQFQGQLVRNEMDSEAPRPTLQFHRKSIAKLKALKGSSFLHLTSMCSVSVFVLGNKNRLIPDLTELTLWCWGMGRCLNLGSETIQRI